ncbi:MAG: amino acid adenylation domain-containing protein [Microcoleus vaginatus WJT46-NPBG5]|jgi:amino acid adenylation domain-containing protein|nr:amino acid adenylation domain-containing protein [Microcoleus vaginatus WJT46-NPBG5]
MTQSKLNPAVPAGNASPHPEMSSQPLNTVEKQLDSGKSPYSNIPLLDLPADRPRSALGTFVGASQHLTLSQTLTHNLKAISQQQEHPLFITLLAVFKILLYRYTGTTEIVIATPAPKHNWTENEGLIAFTNILVLHTQLDGNASFLELAERVQTATLEAYNKPELPFEILLKDRQLQQPNQKPVFQVMFAFDNPKLAEKLETTGLTGIPINFDSESVGYDLTLCVKDTEREVIAELKYDAELFNPDTINRMLGHFQTLLEGIVANPEQRISHLPLLTAAERQQILIEWNNTQTDYPHNTCVHQLFEAQVERTPDAVAAVFQDQQLTYRQLNAKANQLANYLRSLGVGPEVFVGICLERSLEMMVAILGTLKAGGAYVPLDPAYPSERLGFILEDAQTPVLLTQTHLVENFPQHSAQVICLDADWETIAQYNEENPINLAAPSNLAYIIYTSGSTGKPKGTMIPHRGLVNYLSWCTQAYAVAEGQGTLVHSSIGFDLTVTSLFSPLLVGKSVVLLPENQEIEALGDAIRTGGDYSLVKITPAHLEALSQCLTTEKPAGQTRAFIIGGEALLGKTLSYWRTQSPQTRLINEYGPTETVVGCCIYEVPEDAELSGAMPIGNPIANTQLYILDKHLQPVPVGLQGELYIGGAGLARGYLNRPDLTAEKFIANPFFKKEGDSVFTSNRLYKTGDLARYLPDGTIEYLGRIDNQIKLRGFRIELGEIEAALSQHSAVRETAVIVREDIAGDKRLVAYVVPSETANSPLAKELRHFLEATLPHYMVPSAFVMLEVLPLTTNGKVDRKALPAPDASSALSETFVAPRTPIEAALTAIWAEVLGFEQVGIHDNFFELGGHSLLGMQVISRLRNSYQVELPLRSLFEAPTVAELAQKVETAGQQELAAIAPAITPISRDLTLPLSFAQEQLWFFGQLAPDTPVYNEPATIRLIGTINIPALENSLNEIIRRHEALRTTFAEVDGQPVQVIHPTLTLTLPVMDLQELPASEREAEALRLATEAARRPFDLTAGPLIRAMLIQLDVSDCRLFLTLHHIIHDGVSNYSVLAPELAALYEAFCAGNPSPLPELPVQYPDFAHWERQWLQSSVLAPQLDYWQQQLANLPMLQLPTDRPRPAVQTFRGARQCVSLSKSLTEALKALSRRQGVTLYMTLLAAFKTLLHRYAGQDEIVIGTVSSNRSRPEIEGLIGFFLNTLVLRTDCSGNPSFQQLLERVREVTLGAYAHSDVPFEQLVQALQPERSLNQNPLFQVSFVLEPPMPALESGWTLSQLDVETGTAKLDLTLELDERPEGLIGRFEYSTDLFDDATITRMTGHFQTLLEAIVANPDQQIQNLPLLTENERQQLLFEWNNTEIDYPQTVCIHQVFEAQVEQTPDAVAVVCEGEHLTYQELNAKANKIAHHLRSLGIVPDTLVSICAERSLEMMAGILGILKAGAAYVPLDPAYPQDRLSFMLEDTQAPILLTQHRLIEKLPQHNAQVICLDADWETINQHSDCNPNAEVSPEHLAYTIYTSGSTGKPKGVPITHQNLVHSTFARTAYYQEPVKSYLLLSPFAFDSSVAGIFWTLCQGGSLVLPQDGAQADVPQLIELIEQNQVSHWLSLPSLYGLLLSIAKPQQLNSLRAVIVAGEACQKDLIERHRQRLPHACLFNEYGPTEGTVWSTVYDCGDLAENTLVPIGKPIPNMQVYLLDSHLQPVPVGVAGELHIGGAGLASGYLNRPDLTAEKFIANLFSQNSNSRLYKTGDLARYLPDGNIEYLGRIDHQVKIRGFRIELGEIEALLNSHLSVQETAVIPREDVPGDQRLVAYIVPSATANSDLIKEWRRFLKERLPAYMVPSAFVLLEALPLTPNGKLDRKALPAPSNANLEREEMLVAPRNPVEKILADILAQLLGIKEIGIHDNFFELGGHSLLAIQYISRLNDAFGIKIPLRCLFENPTVEGIAVAITENPQYSEVFGNVSIAETQSNAGIKLQKATRSAAEFLPLSFAQERLWFLEKLRPATAFYNIATAIKMTGRLNPSVLEQSLNEILRRHEALRSSFTTVDGQPVQVIASNVNLTLPLIELQSLSENERETETERLTAEEAQRPFELAQAPLVRATLLQLAETEHILLLTVHHIVSDGWSMGLLHREMLTIYQSLMAGEPSSLAEVPVQYPDFAVWHRQWLQTQEAGKASPLETQLSYWKQQLQGAPTALEMPTDRPRPPVQTFRGATHPVALPKPLIEALNRLSRQTGTSLYMTLLAAFNTLLHRYTAQEDIVLGTVTANRNWSEIESLIGFFVNTLLIRTNLSGNVSFRELLNRVREVALGAYAHQDLPFEKLVNELHPNRDLSQNPLFQVMFVFQKDGLETLEIPDLNLNFSNIHCGTAKFDLTLQLQETPSGVNGWFEYSTDLFDTGTIERMAGHFQTLLEGIVANPEQRLSELPILTPAERHQIVFEWNDVYTDYPHDASIQALFEAQVEQAPDAVALIFDKEQLTYRQLNAKANQVAHYLRSLGVGPDVLVSFCMERSLEMIIGILGILKAGGVYVPLDPAYPQERLGYMLEDTQAPVLLAQERLLNVLPAHKAHTVCIDTDWEAIARESEENPVVEMSSLGLAYVMYTSGSTGKPKGVCIPHQGVVRLVINTDYASFTSEEVFLHQSSSAFDPSTLEIWGSLLNGGRLVIGPPHTPSLEELGQVIKQHQVSTLFLTTGLLHVMIDERLEDLQGVRQLLTGGDVFSVAHAQKVVRTLKGCRMVNGYGPTENSTYSSCYTVPDVDQIGNSVSIGRPIANSPTYILDRHLNPVPIGVWGELYVGGPGLARGYWNRPELTAEKFIPNPFFKREGDYVDRLYKTGDLVRYLPDGNIEFLGRIDNQVKIRGFRIELGEIETALNQHPAVRETIVLAHKDAAGDKRLVAYFVLEEGDEQLLNLGSDSKLIQELRGFLKEQLPAYMMPSAFVLLDAFPLTPNGKIDRKALPAPEFSSQEQEVFAAPRDTLELQLAQIWEAVLGVQSISIKDNFFDLGGHSLLAVRLLDRVEKVFGKTFPLPTLFNAPTIEQLANTIRAAGIDTSSETLVPLRLGKDKPPLFCIYGIMLYHGLARNLAEDQPVYGVYLQAEVDILKADNPEKLLSAMSVTSLASKYLKEIRKQQPVGPYYLAGESFGGLVAYEIAQQLRAEGEQVALLALLDSFAPGSVKKAPLPVRVTLHLQNFFRQGFAYALEKVLRRLKFSKKQLLRLTKRRYGKLGSSSERSLPNTRTDSAIRDLRELILEKASENYAPQPYPGKITLFRAIARNEFEATYTDPQLGWGKFAAGELEIHDVPGDHIGILQEPNVKVLAKKLSAYLQKP